MLTNSLTIALISGALLLIAYWTYGRFIARRVLVFDPRRKTPAHLQEDGVDFVPTHPAVLFGHHFASIAGLGPIIGPAIAVFWGWVPALCWSVVGSILIGGVHDMTALYASLRHQARGIGDFTREIMGGRARILFLLIIFFLLGLAMGVFALTMAKLFTNLSPQAVVPTFSLIAIAILIGLLVYKLKWSLGPVTLIGLLLMFVSTFLGLQFPIPLYKSFVTDARTATMLAGDESLPVTHGIRAVSGQATLTQIEKNRDAALKAGDTDKAESYATAAEQIGPAILQAMDTWTYLLLAYAFIASLIPIWLLLQPRDYINSFQLYIGLAVLLLGLLVWRPTIHAPAFGPVATATGSDYAPWFPFLFITIACGSISGFHSLVSSGTTVRQIRNENDAHLIGYGAMLMEGFLAVLVILACVAGLSQAEYDQQYGNWATLAGSSLSGFLTGAGNVAAKPFVWLFAESAQTQVYAFFRNLIAVIVVSFAMTTLDSATRLLRYNVEEIGKTIHVKPLTNRYVASLIAVGAIGFFALVRIDGKPAGLTLWQLFGTTNQLLAGLGLMVVTVYLYQLGKPVVYTILPAVGMFVMVGIAMRYKLAEFYLNWREKGDAGSGYLFVVGAILAAMTVWMIVEGLAAFYRSRIIRMNGRIVSTVAQTPD